MSLCESIDERNLWTQTSSTSVVYGISPIFTHLWFLKFSPQWLAIFYRDTKFILYLLVYVDDIIIMESSTAAVNAYIGVLSTHFCLKDLHVVFWYQNHMMFLGLLLTQRKYKLDLLRHTNMENVKHVTAPMCSSTSLSIHDGVMLDEASEYRQVVGSLQYIALTRPDL